MTPSPRFKLAFKTSLAMVIAYGIAMSMGWEKPSWAAFAVSFCSLSTVGDSVQKGLQRIAGTLFGTVVTLTLIALFPQYRWR